MKRYQLVILCYDGGYSEDSADSLYTAELLANDYMRNGITAKGFHVVSCVHIEDTETHNLIMMANPIFTH